MDEVMAGYVERGDAIGTAAMTGFAIEAMRNPHEDLVGVLLTQRAWESPSPPPVRQDFWTSAYPAIVD
jgi:hypothetical protein